MRIKIKKKKNLNWKISSINQNGALKIANNSYHNIFIIYTPQCTICKILLALQFVQNVLLTDERFNFN